MGEETGETAEGEPVEPVGTEYRVLRYEHAAEIGAPLPKWEDDWEDALKWDVGWTRGIWRFDDGVPREFIGCDGGEPEDQTLGRDWAWVTDALNDAYRLGGGQTGSAAGREAPMPDPHGEIAEPIAASGRNQAACHHGQHCSGTGPDCAPAIGPVCSVAVLYEVGPQGGRHLYGCFVNEEVAREEYRQGGPLAPGWDIEVDTFSVSGYLPHTGSSADPPT